MNVTEQLSEKLENLSAVAKRLSANADGAVAIIKQREQQLRESGIDISVWLDVDFAEGPVRTVDDDKRYPGIHKRHNAYRVGYARVRDERRIAVKQIEWLCKCDPVHGNDDDEYWETRDLDQEPAALAEVGLELRIEAVAHLPALVDALTERACGLVNSAEKVKPAAKA